MHKKPPITFWVIAVAAMVWNLAELYFSAVEIDFIQENTTTEEFQSVQSLPLWYIAVFLAALFAEMVGSFMLFMRRKIAVTLYAIAAIALLFVELYWLLTLDIEKTSIFFGVVIPIIVIAVAAFLYFYSKYARSKGWIN